jgi:hypothetical protein
VKLTRIVATFLFVVFFSPFGWTQTAPGAATGSSILKPTFEAPAFAPANFSQPIFQRALRERPTFMRQEFQRSGFMRPQFQAAQMEQPRFESSFANSYSPGAQPQNIAETLAVTDTKLHWQRRQLRGSSGTRRSTAHGSILKVGRQTKQQEH